VVSAARQRGGGRRAPPLLPSSLRGRLVAAMLGVLLATLAAAAAGPVLLAHAAGLHRELAHVLPGGMLLREPWQDLSTLLPSGLVALWLVWVVSGWSLRPLARASQEAAAVGPGDPELRISSRTLPSEVLPLVVAVNGALDRLAQACATERRFTADAAHSLRTPLATLSLRLQHARAEGRLDWQAMEHDLAHMTRLVAQLLDLARKEQAGGPGGSGAGSTAAAVSLSRVAREAAAEILPMAEERGRGIEVELAGTLMVHGRADDLRDMVRTLLENAVVHGAGAIRLGGWAWTGGAVVLGVADQGAGVPLALRAIVFDRFCKAPGSGPGTGLGLAIVREVVRAHGGSVGFQAGAACEVRVVLPGLAPQAAAHVPIAAHR